MNEGLSMRRYQMYINGQYVDPTSNRWIDSYNPYTGEVWAQIGEGNAEDADVAVKAAAAAFSEGPWSQLTHTERGALLHRMGDLTIRDARKLAETEVNDNGKLIAETEAMIRYTAQWYYYFGGLADKIQGATVPLDKKGYFNFTQYEPVGVVVAITAWNSPLLLAAWKIVAALAAGCTVVIKPSEHASASTLEFAKLFAEAGFPPGVVNVVTGFGADVGSALVEHPLVRKVSFTGSDATGRHINQQAAKHLKPVGLELGGKSPNIVFADANMEDAVKGALSGIFSAAGQTCIAGSRLLLQESIYEEFTEKLVAGAKAIRMGNPQEKDTQMGPIANRPQYEKVLSYIEVAKDDGAELLAGGVAATRPECGNGWFIEPTIFGKVTNTMRIAQEEVFGPILSVITFKDEDDAVRIANDSRFGLGAGVWTKDMGRAFRMANRIQAGTVWINTYRALSFMVPFGGYKDSGIGRENGMAQIYSYLETKNVWINTGAETKNLFVMR